MICVSYGEGEMLPSLCIMRDCSERLDGVLFGEVRFFHVVPLLLGIDLVLEAVEVGVVDLHGCLLAGMGAKQVAV